MVNLSDILSNNNKDIDNQKLMDYLGGKLSAEDQHEVEKQMMESEMVNDAVEGLQDFENKDNIAHFEAQVNRNLKKQLKKKNSRKDKRRVGSMNWVYFSIILLLILAIIAFVVISKHLNLF